MYMQNAINCLFCLGGTVSAILCEFGPRAQQFEKLQVDWSDGNEQRSFFIFIVNVF